MLPMRRFALLLLLIAAPVQARVQVPHGPRPEFASLKESPVDGGVQVKGLVDNKRFVLRQPTRWNGSLVIGAHGGGGGSNFDRSGNVIGTDETALDDVIGRHALAHGFAYASVDRDGAGNGEIGLQLTDQFTRVVKLEVERRSGRPPVHVYLVGLSAGGGIARLAAEDSAVLYEGR